MPPEPPRCSRCGREGSADVLICGGHGVCFDCEDAEPFDWWDDEGPTGETNPSKETPCSTT